MSARPFVEQRAQFGKEDVRGTAVPATSRPASGTLTLAPKVTSDRIRPSGEYFDSLVYQKTQDCEGSFAGTPSWSDLTDYLTLIYGPATTVETVPADPNAEPPVDGSGVWTHTFGLGAQRTTWTVEMGDSAAAARATGVFATGCELSFDSNGGDATLNIDLQGDALEDRQSLTSGVASVTPEPILAAAVRMYIADSLDALDTALPLAGVMKQTLKIASIASLVRYFGSTDTVNTAPDATIELVSVADEVGRGFLADLQTSRTRYIRIEATGAAIAGANPAGNATLTIDTAVQVEDHGRDEQSAVYAATNTFRFVTDANGFSHRVTLTNGSNI